MTFRPFFPRYTKLCVFVSNANTSDQPVGETVVTLPAGYGVQRSSGYNCADFGSQSTAQYYFELYPGDPSGLDADHDGVACEDNSCPCGAEAIPAEPLPQPPALPPAPPPSACNDGKDNDNDGLVDLDDPGCAYDSSATSELPKNMAAADAPGYVRTALAKKFKKSLRHGHAYHRRCSRLGVATFGCHVAWVYRSFRYTGAVKVWYRSDPTDAYWYYSFKVKRRNQSCQATPNTRCTKTYVVH